MIKKIVFSMFLSSLSYASSNNALLFSRSLYGGALLGHGSTTWDGLVPSQKNKTTGLMISTPQSVDEGGVVWGLLAGYEFNPSIAIEAAYVDYPLATINFAPISRFTFDQNGKVQLLSDTKSFSLMLKVMLLFPESRLRFYSSAGVAETYRHDILLKQWHTAPTFGIGFNYRMTPQLMGELGGNYIAGFGESQLNPTYTYIPFIYSVSARLAYFF